jgi:hypothetical protein
MVLKDIFKIKNIKSFIEGNSKYFYDKIIGSPTHITEQIVYRLEQCENDCVVNNTCIICGCPTNKKIFVTESCNPDRFPDLMNNEDWGKYKLDNNIK